MCKKLSSRECNLCQQVNSTILQGQVNTYSGPDRFFPPLPAPNEAKGAFPHCGAGHSGSWIPIISAMTIATMGQAALHSYSRAAFAFQLRGYRPSATPLFFTLALLSTFRQELEDTISRSVRMPFPCRLQGYGRPSPTEGRTTITGLTSAPRRSPSCRRWRHQERPWAGPCRRLGSRSRRLRDGCG